MSAESITLRYGAARCDILLARIEDWPAANWKAAMRLMAKGGYSLNEEAVRTLAEWFPETLRDAKSWWDEVIATHKREFRSYKDTPKDDWERQKYINAALNKTLHEAHRRYDRLSINYKHFMAAKASMKKEI